MDVPLTEESEMKEKKSTGRQKGGIITMPFILGIHTLSIYFFNLIVNLYLLIVFVLVTTYGNSK